MPSSPRTPVLRRSANVIPSYGPPCKKARSRSSSTFIIMASIALGAGTQAVAQTFNLTPIADTYTQQGTPTTNYGTQTTVLIRKDPADTLTRGGYFEFNLSSLPAGTVTSARLQLFGSQDAGGTGVSIKAIPGTATAAWSETTLVYNNALTLTGANFTGTPITTTAVSPPPATTYSWDVTSYIASRRNAGNAIATIGLGYVSPDTYRSTFNSKEAAANRPLLVVTIGGTSNCPVQSSNTTTPGTRTVALVHGGLTRSYILHVPPSYRSATASALVIDMHGFGSTAGTQQSVSGFNAHSDTANYIVAFPQGTSTSWNAGGCCGTGQSSNVDDVGFIRAVVRDIASRANIDLRRVYATGISNGGMMSNRLACQAADVFAAVGPVAGQLWLTGSANAPIDLSLCRPSRPVSVFHINSRDDAVVLFSNGVKSTTAWRTINQCTATSTYFDLGGATENHCDHYNTCLGGARVGQCSIPGEHVAPYRQPTVINVPAYLWTTAFQPHTIATNCSGTGNPR